MQVGQHHHERRGRGHRRSEIDVCARFLDHLFPPICLILKRYLLTHQQFLGEWPQHLYLIKSAEKPILPSRKGRALPAILEKRIELGYDALEQRKDAYQSPRIA